VEKYRISTDSLTPDEIVKYIEKFENEDKPGLDNLWDYYEGENVKILKPRKASDNNPDNRTPVPYGRKIITTLVGYAYRPGYISYKSDNEAFLTELQATFDNNNEKIKTSANGRNTGIYGYSAELLYLDKINGKTDVRFTVIDPRELITFWNFDLEPKMLFAVRFYCYKEENNQKYYKVVAYYPTETIYFDWKREYGGRGVIVEESREANYFGDVPVVIYEFPDEDGIIQPVVPLIDDYDALISDSMNEFDRFSHAYLKLVGMQLDRQDKGASPGAGGIFQNVLQKIKRSRVFDNLKDKDDVTFLTKDIPTDYIRFMTELIAKQIHEQSHVPDFTAFKDLSGIAVERLMFDFENVVSSAEALFDLGLKRRIELITKIYATLGKATGEVGEIDISHKRNTPLNVQEYADTALVMRNTGFSMYSILDYMPDEVIPDVEKELDRQKQEAKDQAPDVDNIPPNDMQNVNPNDNLQ